MRQVVISICLLFGSIAPIKAQIYTPGGTIQGFSGSNNVGIGTASPYRTLHVFSQATPNAFYDGELQVGGFVGTTDDVTISIGTNYTNKTMFLQGWRGGWGPCIPLLLNPLGGNVGIGTITPVSKLDVSGNIALNDNYFYFRSGGDTYHGISYSATYDGPFLFGNGGLALGTSGGSVVNMVLKNSGNVGIGTTTPTQGKLVVNGDIVTNSKVGFGNDPTHYYITTITNGLQYSPYEVGNFTFTNGGGTWSFTNGNVLVGKTTQTNSAYKLDVEGKIRADEVVVNTTGADFVFAPEYKLPNLSEVESYIKEYNHLPDLAPAAEMKENGMNVSEMQIKLLQKIEELTLYSIEQNKRIELLEQTIKELKK
jgi:hypothetical protein